MGWFNHQLDQLQVAFFAIHLKPEIGFVGSFREGIFSPLPVGPWILGVDVPSRFEDGRLGPIGSQPSVRHGNPSCVPSEVWEFSQSCQWKIDDFLGSIERGEMSNLLNDWGEICNLRASAGTAGFLLIIYPCPTIALSISMFIFCWFYQWWFTHWRNLWAVAWEFQVCFEDTMCFFSLCRGCRLDGAVEGLTLLFRCQESEGKEWSIDNISQDPRIIYLHVSYKLTKCR